jgi:hypothetical protein
VYYFFRAVVVVTYETSATARWALLFIVRAFFNDTITVAVWTGFHMAPRGDATKPLNYMRCCSRRGFWHRPQAVRNDKTRPAEAD